MGCVLVVIIHARSVRIRGSILTVWLVIRLCIGPQHCPITPLVTAQLGSMISVGPYVGKSAAMGNYMLIPVMTGIRIMMMDVRVLVKRNRILIVIMRHCRHSSNQLRHVILWGISL